jgi:hypothetical protein
VELKIELGQSVLVKVEEEVLFEFQSEVLPDVEVLDTCS